MRTTDTAPSTGQSLPSTGQNLPPALRDGLFPTSYTIAMLRQDTGRGGSRWVHTLRPGDRVRTSRPRGAFPPVATSRKHLLVAGGIGVTPVLSHARAAARAGRPVQVLYRFRPDAGSHLADLQELADAHPHVDLLTSTGTRADWAAALDAVLTDQPLGTHLYTCGPADFMDDLFARARAAGWPAGRLHSEAFGLTDLDAGAPFTLRLARSGERVPVPADVTALEALESTGRTVPAMCRQGVCGECVLPVLVGRPDHRDIVLTPVERPTCFTPCVSRALPTDTAPAAEASHPELEIDISMETSHVWLPAREEARAADADTVIEHLLGRVEYQQFVRLPHSHAIMMTVRTQMERIVDLASVPEWRENMRTFFATMPADVKVDKGVTRFEPALRRYFEY
ncbi:PDR/VanB family oxidoreductase [Brevibacterium litoralis]|uniref:PDR/VanB family oxidoreductase n=1 Tax=Brevibacterium litoralis TaxID=3138935 RepID=UPI0032EC5BCC